MLFKTILMWVIAAGVTIGGIDYILGNKLGAGKQFYEGFMLMGKSALGMVGILCLAPFVGNTLSFVVRPLFSSVGIDPAMFGSVFAIDMGGYSLAVSMADSQELGLYSGIVVSTLFGPTAVYYLPLGFQMIPQKDHSLFARGIVIGLIVLPVGCLVGGWIMGLSLGTILVNNIPAFLLCAVLIFGMLCSRDRTIRICIAYGKALMIVGVLGIIIAFSQYLTGITILPGMGELSEAFKVVGYITVTVVGFLPLSGLLLKYCSRFLMRIGRRFGLDASGVTAMTVTLGSSTPVLAMIKDMAPRSKVIVTAFLIYSSYAAHLGFTISVAPEMAFALIASKSASAFAAFVLAYFTTKNLESEVLVHE
ncbi:MAG: ethanolamine utilization protein EutH [Firmicutes bacterium]|nr:ethanolamine utilization protein EutH [Bacillota bacterium]